MTQLRMQLYVGKVNELVLTKIAKDLHERGFAFRSGRKLVKDNGEVNNTLLNYKNHPLYLYIYPELKQVTTAWREVTTELYETETYGYGIWKNDSAKGFFADLKARLDGLEAAKNPEIEYVTQEEANNGRWLERLGLKDGDTVKCVKVSSTSGTFTLGKKYKVFKSPTNEKQLRIETDLEITFDIDSFFSKFIKCENVEFADPKDHGYLKCIDNQGFHHWTRGKYYKIQKADTQVFICDNEGETRKHKDVEKLIRYLDNLDLKFEYHNEKPQETEHGFMECVENTYDVSHWTKGEFYKIKNDGELFYILDNDGDKRTAETPYSLLNNINVNGSKFEYHSENPNEQPKEELVPFTPIEAQIQNNLEKIKVYDELIFNMQTKHERLEEHIRELRKKRRVLGEDNKVLERYK